MFEVPESDITSIVLNGDTVRGQEPIKYVRKKRTNESDEKTERVRQKAAN